MANDLHSTLDNADLHKAGRVQTTDPGATGAGKVWFDSTTLTLKIRNSGDTGWDRYGDPAGILQPLAGVTVPSGWLICNGAAVSRTSYLDLFAALVVSLGTFTVTIASPGVVTLSAHGMNDGDSVYLTTTGALPTGLAANTLYYIKFVDANSFQLAATRGGAAINTSVSQSGTHTLRRCPWGLGDGSTTFNVPDLRGRIPVGMDSMGGSSANNIVATIADNIGGTGGEENHTLTIAEMPAHTHDITGRNSATGGQTSVGENGGASALGTVPAAALTTGGGGAHGNLQPYNVVNWIVKI